MNRGDNGGFRCAFGTAALNPRISRRHFRFMVGKKICYILPMNYQARCGQRKHMAAYVSCNHWLLYNKQIQRQEEKDYEKL